MQWRKPYVEFNTKNGIETEKSRNKDGKALYKLMKNYVYSKIIETMRKWIDVKLISNAKDHVE